MERGKAKEPQPAEQIAFWREETPEGLEFLKGRYGNFRFAPHAHDRYLLSLVTNGALEIVDPRRRAIAGPGQVIFYGPDRVHWGAAACPDGWSILSIYLPQEAVRQIARQIGGPPVGTFDFSEIVADDLGLAEKLAALFGTCGSPRESLLRATLIWELVTELLEHHADQPIYLPEIGAESRAVAIAREFLEANFADKVSLDELSKQSGISPFWLIKAFKKAHGIPPHAYLTNLRVRHALGLLRDGMPIAEVALACGFADQSHLTRLFKRSLAVTPGRFQGASGDASGRNLH